MVIFRLLISMINMKTTFFTLLGLFLMTGIFAQKRVSDLTIVYDAVITTGAAEPKLADAFDGATTTVYLKGGLSRSEMQSALASFTTIHDARSGSAVVLQEVGGQKVLIRMTAADWKDKNRRYEGIEFTTSGETKQLAGYTCKKAVASLKTVQLLRCFIQKTWCLKTIIIIPSLPTSADFHLNTNYSRGN